MKVNLERLADFAIGASIPGSLIWEEHKYSKQEKINSELKKVELTKDEDEWYVLPTVDLGTYIAQAGFVAYGLNNNSNASLLTAGGIAALRGIVKLYQTYRRRVVEKENSELATLKKADTNVNRVIYEREIQSRMLPGR